MYIADTAHIAYIAATAALSLPAGADVLQDDAAPRGEPDDNVRADDQRRERSQPGMPMLMHPNPLLKDEVGDSVRDLEPADPVIFGTLARIVEELPGVATPGTAAWNS